MKDIMEQQLSIQPVQLWFSLTNRFKFVILISGLFEHLILVRFPMVHPLLIPPTCRASVHEIKTLLQNNERLPSKKGTGQ